jgi:hypothetical protein
MLYDVFICHASEDKDSFVRPLAERLRKAHLEVWFDEFSLSIGDSLRESIDKGLAKSTYGIVVLSPSFFKKKWPQRELNGLVAREMSGENRIILPIWHNITASEILKYSPPLADLKAVESRRGLDFVYKELLKKLRPEESPLLTARDELIKFGMDPPVITDEWWLDVVEASNRIPCWGFAIPENTIWGRWTFPLPCHDSRGKERGIWLAWTAMQIRWEKEADDNEITQITKPDKVLWFIGSQPGLKEMCHEHPELLAIYAPQLTIRGLGGEFEEQFEEMLSLSVKHYENMRKGDKALGSALTKNQLVPACSEEIALRHPTFGNHDSAIIACNFVQGELGGPKPKFYEVFEYLIWLLSSDSAWLPKKVHSFLLDGIKEWGVWVSSYPQDLFDITRDFFNSLWKAKSYKTFKFSAKEKKPLLKWIEHSLTTLNLTDNPNTILDEFLSYGFIESFIEKQTLKNTKGK